MSRVRAPPQALKKKAKIGRGLQKPTQEPTSNGSGKTQQLEIRIACMLVSDVLLHNATAEAR
eukprot:16773-Heterococcus_DN1.PRE.2